jgi:hypothetical protein
MESSIPTITILGTGKSTILNDITGHELFKGTIGSRSQTDDYIMKTTNLIGDEKKLNYAIQLALKTTEL